LIKAIGIGLLQEPSPVGLKGGISEDGSQLLETAKGSTRAAQVCAAIALTQG
jgi:hypothetical protein